MIRLIPKDRFQFPRLLVKNGQLCSMAPSGKIEEGDIVKLASHPTKFMTAHSSRSRSHAEISLLLRCANVNETAEFQRSLSMLRSIRSKDDDYGVLALVLLFHPRGASKKFFLREIPRFLEGDR